MTIHSIRSVLVMAGSVLLAGGLSSSEARADAGRSRSQSAEVTVPISATRTYPFADGAIYAVQTAPGRVTDIALQPGESLGAVASGDTARWVIGDTSSGSGAGRLGDPSRAAQLQLRHHRRRSEMAPASRVRRWTPDVHRVSCIDRGWRSAAAFPCRRKGRGRARQLPSARSLLCC